MFRYSKINTVEADNNNLNPPLYQSLIIIKKLICIVTCLPTQSVTLSTYSSVSLHSSLSTVTGYRMVH